DIVELSNLQRQILHTTASVGRPKAESGRDMLAAFNPQAQVHARVERLKDQSLSDAVAAADLVLD
ncbi:MAG TPA: molybdopterin biosynthesis protein MoeB, partial [Achromobacter sp.]|nr:molybdopterin biosynthesis protein MoeB [Achromobacter sp.]